MKPATAESKNAIRQKVIEIAKMLGNDARGLKDSDVIPKPACWIPPGSWS